MKTKNSIKVVVADSSVIIRNGVTSVLKKLSDYMLSINEISNMEALQMFIRMHTPDLLIVNPLFANGFNVLSIRKDFPDIKIIALVSGYFDKKILMDFDAAISIFDEIDSINSKMNDILSSPEDETEETDQLSTREKEIIACVVKGLTNKAIADQLSISIHTVITHRRNISKKLQIHSSAGLAIYAIVNKIVEIQDIKDGAN